MDEWKENGAYLEHHGILGQKWGVRRYQNLDGTLTAAGRARYGTATVPGTSEHPSGSPSEKFHTRTVTRGSGTARIGNQKSSSGGGFSKEIEDEQARSKNVFEQLEAERDEEMQHRQILKDALQAVRNGHASYERKVNEFKEKLSKMDHRSPGYSTVHRDYVRALNELKRNEQSIDDFRRNVVQSEQRLAEINERISKFANSNSKRHLYKI